MPNDDTSAAGVLLTLRDGQTLTMQPLTDEDMDLLTEWCQSRIINVADRSIPTTFSKAEREERLTVAIKAAAHVTWMSHEGARMLSSVDGVTFMCWLAVRHANPGVTLAELRLAMKDARNQDKFNVMFRKANGLAQGPPKNRRRTK